MNLEKGNVILFNSHEPVREAVLNYLIVRVLSVYSRFSTKNGFRKAPRDLWRFSNTYHLFCGK